MTVSKRNDGSSLSKTEVDELRSKIQGQVVVKGEAPEDVYRPLLERWNRMHIKEANIIVLPDSEEEVAETIKFAAKHNLDVSISAGRHTYSGPSSGYGLIIDLRKLRKVTVDASRKVAIAQGGSLAGDVEAACEPHGLRPVMGTVNATGCGGITTGGGIGFMTGQYGLVCDSLESARVALADGSVVVASETENSDLFWGIRGGGSNFGIVTEFTYKVYERPTDVYYGFCMLPPDKMDTVLGMLNSLHVDAVCKSDGKLVLLGFFPVVNGAVIPGFIVCYDGPEEEGKRLIQPLLDLEPIQNTVKMLPYTQATDWEQFIPLFKPGYDRLVGSSTQVSYPVADEVFQKSVQKFKELVLSDPERLDQSKLFIDLRDYRKMAAVPLDATAYAGRRAGCIISADIIWDDSNLDQKMFKETQAYMKDLRETIKGINKQKGIADVGQHVAATTLYALVSDGEEKLVSVFGPNLPRLKEVKKKYDPGMMWNKWYPVTPEGVN